MLSLQLFPSEFRELIGYLTVNTEYQQTVPLRLQLVGKLIMLNYISKWTPHRIYAWQQRNPKKAYALRLPVVVGLALWQDMRGALLTGHQQLLLSKLDQAIINYRHPHEPTFSHYLTTAY